MASALAATDPATSNTHSVAAAVGRVLDLGRHHGVRAGQVAASSRRGGHVLPPVHREGDRRRVRHVAQAHGPQPLPGGRVVGVQPPVERAGEQQTAARDEGAGGLRRALAGDPHGLVRLQVHRLDAPVVAVALGARPHGPAHAGRQAAALVRADGHHVHARLGDRHVDDLRLRVVRRGRPAPAAADVRAHHLRLAVAGDRPRVDDLRAGGRVDAGDAVLQPEVDRRHVLAGPGLDDVEDRLLAGGHHHAGRLAAHRQLDHLPLERPVEVPLAVGLVLEVPRQLARVGVQRQRPCRGTARRC